MDEIAAMQAALFNHCGWTHSEGSYKDEKSQTFIGSHHSNDEYGLLLLARYNLNRRPAGTELTTCFSSRTDNLSSGQYRRPNYQGCNPYHGTGDGRSNGGAKNA